MITEEFLHYIWKYRTFNQKKLRSVEGENIKIINPGQYNSDGGPDFSNAQIKIDETLWAGNVEIHVKSSDWFRHKHSSDNLYDNIILHVVFINDSEVRRKDGTIIPVIELNDLIDNNTLIRFSNMMQSKNWIPCQSQIKSVKTIILSSWYNRLLIERLERKSKAIAKSLSLNKNNWEQTFFEYLASNFGFKLNSIPFELLCKSISSSIIAKHANNLLQLEALFFGQAGMLEISNKDEYVLKLKEEYQFLKQKFDLKPIKTHLWKFLRLNPAGFPTIRIAQFATLMYKTNGLFSKIIEAKNIYSIEQIFNIECSEYWDTHYTFGEKSIKRTKKLGKAAIDIIIINTVVPFLFVYGNFKNDESIKDKALLMLEQINAEKNSVISKFKSLGLPAKTAVDSQALLEMRNYYCIKKICLNCSIGLSLLNKK